MEKLLIVLLLITSVLSEPVTIDIGPCREPEFADIVCTIDSVKVDECKITRTKDCRLKRGTNYTMAVDFTPDFEGSDVTMLAYALLPGIDTQFAGMNGNACDWMTCPVVKDAKNTYTFALSMDRNYPTGTFTTRWLMRKAGVSKCCFTNRFKIE